MCLGAPFIQEHIRIVVGESRQVEVEDAVGWYIRTLGERRVKRDRGFDLETPPLSGGAITGSIGSITEGIVGVYGTF